MAFDDDVAARLAYCQTCVGEKRLESHLEDCEVRDVLLTVRWASGLRGWMSAPIEFCRVLLTGRQHRQSGSVGGLFDEQADVVEYLRVFDHVGFFLC